MSATEQATDLATTIAQAAADKLATDANNERQVEAVVDAVEEAARNAGHKPVRREGQRDGRWVLLDYGDVVAHIQHTDERVFYALERLWNDCPFIPFVDAAAARTRGVAPE